MKNFARWWIEKRTKESERMAVRQMEQAHALRSEAEAREREARRLADRARYFRRATRDFSLDEGEPV